MEPQLLYTWTSKALVYGLGQLAIGLAVVHWLTFREPRNNQTYTGNADPAWLDRVALAISCLFVVALLFRLWAQTASAFGTPDAWLLENLQMIGLESRWGARWRLQLLAVVGLLFAALLMRVHRVGRIAFAGCALGVAATIPLLGHAAGNSERYVLHLVHHLAAAAWLGTVGVLTLCAWREGAARASIAPLPSIARFSLVASTAAAVVLASGVVAAVLYVGSWPSLWTTFYGRMLTLKVGVVAIITVCGWTNWRAVRRGHQPRLSVMTIESIAALSVLGLTGVLTEAEHP